jgi:hypothetical protein
MPGREPTEIVSRLNVPSSLPGSKQLLSLIFDSLPRRRKFQFADLESVTIIPMQPSWPRFLPQTAF